MEINRYQVQFEKDKTFLKAFLEGRNYLTALKVLGWIERTTQGKFRKDGKMPELHHMVRLALAATQLGLPHTTNGFNEITNKHSMSIEERLICVMLLHDAVEDDETFKLEMKDIRNLSDSVVADSVWLMTKEFRGTKKDKQEYINDLSQLFLSSLGKGLDRNDNLEYMIGTFTLEKIIAYTNEAKTEHYPMLKRASKLHTEYARAFRIVMYRMKSTIKMLEQYIELALEKKTVDVSTVERVSELEKNVEFLKTEIKNNAFTSITKTLNIFHDVTEGHKMILMRKLCTEFNVSETEYLKFVGIFKGLTVNLSKNGL